MKIIKPMLCKHGDKKDLDKLNYIFEPKLDGTRAICYINKKIELINRRGINITKRYPEFNFRQNVNSSCILDGEIIVYGKDGMPNFNLLQKREQLEKEILIELRSKEIPATFVVFDILMKDGKNLINYPLKERKKILAQTIKEDKRIEIIPFTQDGKKLWKEITSKKGEGVVGKNLESKYSPNARVSDWIKIKFFKSVDCVLIGFTQEKRIISAFLLGLYDNGQLRYVGKVGTGFTEKFLQQIFKKMSKIIIPDSPVKNLKNINARWISPKLVGEIKYLEFTKDKILRAPVFLRMREDKKPKDCTFNQ